MLSVDNPCFFVEMYLFIYVPNYANPVYHVLICVNENSILYRYYGFKKKNIQADKNNVVQDLRY